MRKVYEDLAHALVEDNGVRLLHKLANDFAFVVLNDKDL